MAHEGDCYLVHANAVIDGRTPTGGVIPCNAVLVHGRPVLQRAPFIRYGHAWIEVGDGPLARVIDLTGPGFDGPLFYYYALGRIDPMTCFRYDQQATRRMLVGYGHYGPWEGPDGCPPTREED